MIFTSPPFLSAAVMASKVASTADAAVLLVMLAFAATAAISSFLVIAKSFPRSAPNQRGFARRAFAENPLIASRIGRGRGERARSIRIVGGFLRENPCRVGTDHAVALKPFIRSRLPIASTR